MNEAVTYRIVGAIVLMALAVIFVPMLLDGSGRKEVTTVNIDTPPAPKYVFSKPVETLPLPKAPVAEQVVESAVETSQPEPEQAKDVVSAVTIAKDTPDELKGWIVQVAALSSHQKAKELSEKLQKQKFAAFVEQSENSANTIYRVKVGPELTEASAKTLLSRIEKQLGMKNLLIKRHPEEVE